MKLDVNTSRRHLRLVKESASPGVSDDERSAEALRMLRSWTRAKERQARIQLADQISGASRKGEK